MTTLNREIHNELTELIEDSVEYFCDQHMMSGELTCVIIECLSKAKQAQLKGECV